MATLSNELKAVVILEDLIEAPTNIMRENCLTIQNFDYQCVRKRTQKGGVYGAMDPVVMTFSVRVNDQLHALRFFKAIASNQMTVMSFLFNAVYDERQRLKDFEDGMVVRGFVVGAEEVYKNEAAQDSQFQQMLLNIKLLVSTVTYMGYEDVNNLTGVFINNNVSDK